MNVARHRKLTATAVRIASYKPRLFDQLSKSHFSYEYLQHYGGLLCL